MNLHIYLSIILFVNSLTVFSQQGSFDVIDDYAMSAPSSKERNVEVLAEYLIEPASDNVEKVRSFYIWLTHNIEYDIKAFLRNELMVNETQEMFLKRKKGVCQDYAELFHSLCEEAGIKSYVVSGYSKGISYDSNRQISEPDHSWNVVAIDKEWYLLDATWGSGFINEKGKFERRFTNRFFLAEPKRMIYTHLPADPMWQLLDCPVSIELFRKDSVKIKNYLEKKDVCFDYKDSVAAFEKLPPGEQALKTAISSYKFNPKNQIVIGLAYLNYGVRKSEELINNKDEYKPEEMLEGFKNSLEYFEKAKGFIKKSGNANAGNILRICNQNIQNTKANIRSYENFLKQK